ncbi:MAG TPA: radical SAM protein [Acidimicrobiales bacterium]|nr:radical SAM protein [Acidimicrobiales bacterium]
MSQGRGPACLAPFVSLHLDPLGDVRACCQNSWYRLGRYPDQRLDDIWRGAPADELRRRLAAHDFSAGCHACAPGSLDDLRGQVYARRFDHLGGTSADGGAGALAWPAQLELQLSTRCNLQCTMCTGLSSSAIRAQREHLPPLPQPYDEAFFVQLEPFLAHVERIELLGGEPFLADETKRLVATLDRIGRRPRIHVTTNGTIWTPWVEDLLERFEVDVTVSIDGSTPATFEAVRVGASFERVAAALDRFAATCARRGTELSIATCLMRETASDFHGLLAWADRLDIDVYVNTVTDPPGSSLAFASAAELADLVRRLDAQAGAAPLGRNQPVWEAEVARLRRLAADAAEGADDAVGGHAIAADPSLLAAWSGGHPVHAFAVDAHQVLVAVTPDPADVFELDLRPVVGSPVSSWIEPLTARYGTLVSSEVARRSDGTSEWVLVVDGERGRHTVRALGLPGDDGARWLVHLRPDQPAGWSTPTPVAAPRRRASDASADRP